MSRIKDVLVDKLDMPYELFNDEAKLTLYGKKRVIVERHKGIAVYREDEIKINSNQGLICIKGSGLTIRNYGKDDIIIDGEFETIAYGEI